jgi:hypothetical protein
VLVHQLLLCVPASWSVRSGVSQSLQHRNLSKITSHSTNAANGRNNVSEAQMCLFSTKKEDRYVRNWDDPAPHRSYYSAHPDGTNAVQARLPSASFDSRRRSNSRRRHDDYDFVQERPRRSREYIEYDSRREIDYARRRELDYYPASRPRSSAGSVGLPNGYVREVRPR